MNRGQDGGNDAILSHESSSTVSQTVVIPDKSNDIYSAYVNCINTYLNNLCEAERDFDDNYFFLYDITGDGSPELWIVINAGPSKVDQGLFVYTYDNGLCKNIFKNGSNIYSDIGIGNKCVICEHGGSGAGGFWYVISKLTWDGKKIIETIIKHTEEWENVDDPDGGYETKVMVDKTDEYLPTETKHPKTSKLCEAYKLTTGSSFE